MKNRVWQYWTAGEDEKLAELWAEGLSEEKISIALKTRARSSIRSRVQRLGLSLREPEIGAREIAQRVPTLAHVPGVTIHGRYSTRIFRMEQRSIPHGALKRPRPLFASPVRDSRVVHLGGGKVWTALQLGEVPFQ